MLDVTYVSLVRKLRRRAAENPVRTEQLNNILWYSEPIVYTNWDILYKRAEYELDKQKAKRRRIRKYIKGMVESYDCLYLASFTFADEFLSSLSSATRLRYLKRWLSDYSLDYYACIDFGAVNGREHYHCILALSSCFVTYVDTGKNVYPCLTDKASWPYGFCSLRFIKVDSQSLHKTINYAFKASSYAFKNMRSDIKPFHKRGAKHLGFVEAYCDEILD